MNHIARLIPELAAWNDGKGIDVESWISGIGRYDHAIGYCTLFWPEFTVHDDCVFRCSIDVDTYARWMDALGGDKRATEAIVNHAHILGLFVSSEFRPSKDVILYIGSLLRDMWACKLNRDLPTRQFQVEFPYGDAAELADYQITFFQRTAEESY